MRRKQKIAREWAAMGAYLRDTREEMGLRADIVANLVGLGPAMMCHIEMGRRRPSLKALVGMMRLYQLDWEQALKMIAPMEGVNIEQIDSFRAAWEQKTMAEDAADHDAAVEELR